MNRFEGPPQDPTIASKQGNKFDAGVVAGDDQKTVDAVCALEKAVFEEGMRMEDEDLKSVVENPQAITVLLRDHNQEAKGFMLALPNDVVHEELHEDDQAFEADPQSLYIYDLGIEEKSRGLANFLALAKTLVHEAGLKGFKKLTMHTRKSEGLSEVLQKRYKARQLRTLDDWQGYGEPFDYLELDIPQENTKN